MQRPLLGDVDRRKMLLSPSTEEGLIISSLAMAALVKKVLNAGADYVLARRINQDLLESYFGQQQRRGWRSDAPTIRLFGSNARILTLTETYICDRTYHYHQFKLSNIFAVKVKITFLQLRIQKTCIMNVRIIYIQ